MPIALEPGLTFPVVLDCDETKEVKPTTMVRALSGRGHRDLAAAYDAAIAAKSVVEMQDYLVGGLTPVIAGWSNMVDPVTGQPIDYSPDKLLDVFNTNELFELSLKTLKAGRLTSKEKNESAQQP